MSFEWPVVKLEDVVNLLTGFPFTSNNYSIERTGYKLLRGDNVVQGRFRWDDVKLWPIASLIDKHTKYLLRTGDVILAMDRPWIEAGLKFAQVSSDDLPCLLVQRVACLRSKEQLNQDFLRYLISSRSFVEYVKQVQTGTAVPHISSKQILAFEFNLPPAEIQISIGRVLKRLDEKIQLNIQINQTLEQMAQALFKSWFVDFEPVKAKITALKAGGTSEDATLAAMIAISGKDTATLAVFAREQPEKYGKLRATAELFPAAMQDSELGKIPQGWPISEIGKEISIAGGGTPSTKEPEYWENGVINWTTPRDLSGLQDKVLFETERKITKKGLGKISSGLLPVDTVLMSSRAPVGYLALAKIPLAINQGYIAMKCNQDLSPVFVLQWCVANMLEIKSRASGTTFAEISKKNFSPISVIKPTKKLVIAYTSTVANIYSLIEGNARNSGVLTQLRDTLLPKLLSGEITLPEAEAWAAQTETQEV